MTSHPWLPLLLLTTGGCGAETALLVEVDLSAFSVPGEVDRVYLQLRNETEPIIGRYFLLEDDIRPIYRLFPGPRTPKRFTLVAYADFREAPVAASDPLPARFVEGEVRQVTIVVPRPRLDAG